ncbi:glycoside hydrolase superfamily [Xylaria intraflava]|nr:glycoside hydrolase superfamily [Xylaria intraflava]
MGTVGPRYSYDAPLGRSYTDHDDTHHLSRQLPSADHSPYDPSSQPLYEDQSEPPYREDSHSLLPGAHSDPAFRRSRQSRSQGSSQPLIGSSASDQRVSPPYLDTGARTWGHEAHPNSITPGADNFSEAAAGGIPGLAMSVAERHARESGLEATRNAQPYQQQPPGSQSYQQQQQPQPRISLPANAQPRGHDPAVGPGPYPRDRRSLPYLAPPLAGPIPVPRGPNSFHNDAYADPQMAYGQRMDPRLGQVNPNEIDDDGDDGLEYRRSARNSMLSLGNSSRGGNGASTAALGVAGATTAGGVLGGLLGKNQNSAASYYAPVQNSSATQSGDPGKFDLGPRAEKSDWIVKQSSSRKKWSWIIAIVILLIIAGAVVGGVLGSKFAKKGNDDSGGTGQSASDDSARNGDLNLHSGEIQALLNNPNLHKVFPGVDYTPINVQYPACLVNPPSQNNVTRDVAILSQLTNTIRLYGTDCNQTEMTIHAVKQLEMEDEIKIWLGVWQDQNDTTNARQLHQMWRILDQYGDKPFKGLIVGNEILFRQQMTTQQLGDLLDSVRSNLSDHNWNLPVATSDLGDNWTAELAKISDYIMGNVHPFFAGQDSKVAASWTTTFWNTKAGSFFKSDPTKNVISEIGWPTQGGTDCGGAASCDDGAVAGIDELNTLLSTWVCQALQNGTNYFWFEMFDEPWKLSFDKPGMAWEDHWGILDVNRKLKQGVKIPDCGGKTV